MLRGAAASAALLATGCAAPPTVATRMLRLGAIGSDALPADGSRPLGEQDINEALREEGFVAGKNMTIEWRQVQGNSDLFLVFAHELVNLPVDILITSTGAGALAAKNATSTIPIVINGCPDPIEQGIIQSYARPGGNVTGSAFSNVSETIKRLELLREAFPAISRVVVIGNVAGNVFFPPLLAELRKAAAPMGIEVGAPEVRTDDDVQRALEGAIGSDALLALGNTLTFQNIPRIVSFAAAQRLPAVYSQDAFVTAGGLMSYGSDRREGRRRVASFVRRIADGASPAILPVELPTKFDLAVNLATAGRAGFSLPASVMARATKVIP